MLSLFLDALLGFLFDSGYRLTIQERPMRVEIALDPSTLVSLASRVAPAPAAAAARGGAARGGRGGARGGAGKPRAARPTKKTAEELDAEMAVSLKRWIKTDVFSRTRIPRLRMTE